MKFLFVGVAIFMVGTLFCELRDAFAPFRSDFGQNSATVRRLFHGRQVADDVVSHDHRGGGDHVLSNQRGRASADETYNRSLSTSSASIEPRIVGGEESKKGDFPYFGTYLMLVAGKYTSVSFMQCSYWLR